MIPDEIREISVAVYKLRQPKRVTVTLTGESEDVAYWLRELMRRAEFKGDSVTSKGGDAFTIYPRAVND
jgi:hypothetical protein